MHTEVLFNVSTTTILFHTFWKGGALLRLPFRNIQKSCGYMVRNITDRGSAVYVTANYFALCRAPILSSLCLYLIRPIIFSQSSLLPSLFKTCARVRSTRKSYANEKISALWTFAFWERKLPTMQWALMTDTYLPSEVYGVPPLLCMTM